ncbi:YwqG family protein [Brevibacillus choshinensis]|uniref:YwqG family protein n=1 Tax=Brevibacillus choshinensis TaxID=54911 RepID=UPI002E245424|nr:YwqG family protein [Brevibacillus choshinensis]
MINQVKALIQKHGLQGMEDQILTHLHECIYAQPTQSLSKSVGTSRLGGSPDLPPGWTYPVYREEPLVFIGQLNLEEIQHIGVANKLPQRGLLYFFYEAAEQSVYGELKDRDGWRVLFFDGDFSTLQTASYPGTHPHGTLPANDLLLRKGLSLHSDAIKVPEKHWDAYYDEFLPDFSTVNGSYECNHQILGHPHNIQGDVFEEIDYFRDVESGGPYTLLLQVDTDETNLNIMWGDVGTIYFVIANDDLREGSFEHTYFSYQCC